jgi:hypothetical protein
VQTAPHVAKPAAHIDETQTPIVHVSPGGQALLHMPQLALSVCVLVQNCMATGPQTVWPAAHMTGGTQVPFGPGTNGGMQGGTHCPAASQTKLPGAQSAELTQGGLHAFPAQA